MAAVTSGWETERPREATGRFWPRGNLVFASLSEESPARRARNECRGMARGKESRAWKKQV